MKQEVDSNSASSFRFKHSISRRRSHLVKRVIFDGEEKEHLRDLLSFAHGFVNMNFMYLDSSSIQLLLGDLSQLGTSDDEELEEIHHSFKRLAETISSLTLDDFRIPETSAILSLFPKLKMLALTFVSIDSTSLEETSDEQKLGLILSNLSLEHLDIGSGEILVIPRSWIELEWASCVTLTSIHINAPNITPSCLQLISKFSSSLRTLRLHVTYLEIDPDFKFTNLLTALSTLDLFVDEDNVSTLISLFFESPLVLLSLSWSTWDPLETPPAMDASLSVLIPKIPSLKHLIISNRFIPQDLSILLTGVCTRLNIKLEHTKWRDQFLNDEDDWPFENSDQLLYYKPAISKALKYGERKLSTLNKEKDVEGMKEMFENCEWLRASAAEMMD